MKNNSKLLSFLFFSFFTTSFILSIVPASPGHHSAWGWLSFCRTPGISNGKEPLSFSRPLLSPEDLSPLYTHIEAKIPPRVVESEQ